MRKLHVGDTEKLLRRFEDEVIEIPNGDHAFLNVCHLREEEGEGECNFNCKKEFEEILGEKPYFKFSCDEISWDASFNWLVEEQIRRLHRKLNPLSCKGIDKSFPDLRVKKIYSYNDYESYCNG